MLGPIDPPGHLQAPALGQMLACRTDPGINAGIADDGRHGIEPALLRTLVRVVKIELVRELIQRD